MNAARLAGFVLSCLLLVGCALMPEWRAFQAKVDPKLAEKPAAQVEAERRAAAFIRDASAQPAADPVAQVAVIHAVAAPLASSLGEPRQAAAAEDKEKVISDLRQGVLAEQRKAEQWRAFARKYAGKEIEGTGIDLAGPTGLLVLVAIVAACIACPAFGYVALRVVPLLWGFFRRTTQAIGEFTAEHQDAGEQLKAKLSKRMDAAHKALVRRRAARPRVAAAAAVAG